MEGREESNGGEGFAGHDGQFLGEIRCFRSFCFRLSFGAISEPKSWLVVYTFDSNSSTKMTLTMALFTSKRTKRRNNQKKGSNGEADKIYNSPTILLTTSVHHTVLCVSSLTNSYAVKRKLNTKIVSQHTIRCSHNIALSAVPKQPSHLNARPGLCFSTIHLSQPWQTSLPLHSHQGYGLDGPGLDLGPG